MIKGANLQVIMAIFFSTLKCEMFHVTNQLSVVKCISKVEILIAFLKKTFLVITVITLAPIELYFDGKNWNYVRRYEWQERNDEK